MKRVSFGMAKYLKKVDYKFIPAPSSCFTNDTNSWYDEDDDELYTLPYVMEVWLWLWREKDIRIVAGNLTCFIWQDTEYEVIETAYSDPEEAIIAAIKYLVDNDLIK